MASPRKIELESLLAEKDYNNDSFCTSEADDDENDDDSETMKYRKRSIWSECHRWTILVEVVLTMLVLVTIATGILVVAGWFTPPKSQSVAQRYSLSIREQQIQNFINGSGLMLNFHITHHAGTTMCAKIGRPLGAPQRYCNHPRDKDPNVPSNYPDYDPWRYEETERNIQLVRQAYRFLAWEHRSPPHPNLDVTNWEHPQLLSVLIVRDPISRLLAGSGDIAERYPNLHSSQDEGQWWEFAKDKRNNNFALRILAGHGCCNDSGTSQEHLDRAKELLSRFTIILDLACLDENLQAMIKLLHLEELIPPQRILKSNHTHPPNSERIPFPEIHQYLKDRNQKDIELYQWAKRKSLVQCLDQGDP